MTEPFKHHAELLKKFRQQRTQWLFFGYVFLMWLFFIVIQWPNIEKLDKNLWIIIGFVCLTVGATWWFWTMEVIRKLINFRRLELEILDNTLEDIREVKNKVSNNATISSQDQKSNN
jgi:hypothetical protein